MDLLTRLRAATVLRPRHRRQGRRALYIVPLRIVGVLAIPAIPRRAEPAEREHPGGGRGR